MAGERLCYLAARLAYDSAWTTDLYVMSISRDTKNSAGAKEAAGEKPWQSVRKAKVERARNLVKDANYPPKEVTDAVANLLARHLKGRTE